MINRALAGIPCGASSFMLTEVIKYSVTAEGLHEVGREGVMKIRRWLDSTARFDMSHSAYDLDKDGHQLTQVRVEQLDGSFETFDLVGDIRDEVGRKGNTIYVECKNYSQAGNQAQLYDEYLATCYSAFASRHQALENVPSIEFMWVTTHPFAVTNFSKLTDQATIAAACSNEAHHRRLGTAPYDPALGDLLAERLWLVVASGRMLNEMIMGDALRAAVLGKMVELGSA